MIADLTVTSVALSPHRQHCRGGMMIIEIARDDLQSFSAVQVNVLVTKHRVAEAQSSDFMEADVSRRRVDRRERLRQPALRWPKIPAGS